MWRRARERHILRMARGEGGGEYGLVDIYNVVVNEVSRYLALIHIPY